MIESKQSKRAPLFCFSDFNTNQLFGAAQLEHQQLDTLLWAELPRTITDPSHILLIIFRGLMTKY